MPNTIHWNVHTKAYNHKAGTHVGKSSTFNEPWNRFLVYGIEWYAGRIDFLVDGTRYMTYANEGSAAAWPFDAEQSLLINLAIGGSWGGRKGVDMALLPHRYEIDYVRIYRHGRAPTRTDLHLKEQCLTECLSTWQRAHRG
jgi:beta-glucanase (GH16 family)